MSSKTIYSRFETREHLIVTALELWMTANVYLKVAMPDPDESLHDVLIRFLRAQFAPWEPNRRELGGSPSWSDRRHSTERCGRRA